MKKVVQILPFAFFLFLMVSACSPKYGIYSAKAYLRESNRGTQQVNDNNLPAGSTRLRENLLYIETAMEKPPVFTTAWIDQKAYTVQAVKAQPNVTIGTTKDSNQEVSITVKEGNQLWQLLLTENHTASLDTAARTVVEKHPIVLTGIWKEKSFVYPVENRTILEGILYQ
ncbi:MAG: hypothetical protein JWP69_370 [Flaviaesturariibacter sp.]|nr:hypothetical protein [Flaviaesturariibacter sp.]